MVHPSQRRGRQRNQLRIIGGEWGGRKFRFPDIPGLRPTPDRIRETLFNWLQPVIDGAHCLDLFAGSGALSLEALSRGALEAVVVDRDKRSINNLRKIVEEVNSEQATLIHCDYNDYLQRDARQFDIIFLDPPYGKGMLEDCCRKLESGGWLANNARIYLEEGSHLGKPQLPDNWSYEKTKQAGQVGYYLAVRE